MLSFKDIRKRPSKTDTYDDVTADHMSRGRHRAVLYLAPPSLGTGISSSFDLFGLSFSRLHRQLVRRTPEDAIAGYWDVVGASLRTAMAEYEKENPAVKRDEPPRLFDLEEANGAAWS